MRGPRRAASRRIVLTGLRERRVVLRCASLRGLRERNLLVPFLLTDLLDDTLCWLAWLGGWNKLHYVSFTYLRAGYLSTDGNGRGCGGGVLRLLTRASQSYSNNARNEQIANCLYLSYGYLFRTRS